MLVFLFFLFLIFKLAGAIAWSWWFVTLPLWIIVACMVNVKLFGHCEHLKNMCAPLMCPRKDEDE